MTQIKELMDAYQADELLKELVFPLVAKIKNKVRALKRECSAWDRKHVAAGHLAIEDDTPALRGFVAILLIIMT
jgi:hypothetical protein